MSNLIMPLVFAVVFVVLIVLGYRAQKRIAAEFAAWVAAQGLTALQGRWWSTPLEANGTRAGRQVRVHTFTTGSGKSRQTWLSAGVRAGADGRLELSIVRQGFGTKISEWFGAKEVTVGDAEFDGRWFIKSNRETFIQAALLPEIRARIDAVAALGGRALKIEVKGGWATYVERGGVSKKSLHRVELALPLLEELATLAEVEAAG
ncbi:MAG: hypothetical protein RIQ79_313 [Verrucomicrobiota bacterium]